MRLLLGGSPCTHWSIAQTRNRETQPEGLGWELFQNYLIARERYKPDYFLYENNKSMAPAIRAQITEELGVTPILINSALVSAQNRQRLYWTNIPNIQQPQDRGLILLDILDSGMTFWEKGYALKASYAKASAANALDGGHFPAPMVIEPVNITADGKAQCLRASYYKDGIRNLVGNTIDRKTCVAQIVHIGDIVNGAAPANLKEEKVGVLPNEAGELTQCQSKRIYSVDAKGRVLNAGPGGLGVQTGLYAVPLDCDVVITENSIRCQRRDKKRSTVQGSHVNFENGKSQTLSPSHIPQIIVECDGKTYPIYEVLDGQITIKGTQYPIKLADGYYIIRKLTVAECKRLQTVPEDYIFPVSNTQAYKMLGNGWTVDVIAHILSFCPGITAEPLEVLSMYDGMSCGQLALDKLGANVIRYYSTEIDKYAIKTTQTNFPNTIQLGDAYHVREKEWWSFFDL